MEEFSNLGTQNGSLSAPTRSLGSGFLSKCFSPSTPLVVLSDSEVEVEALKWTQVAAFQEADDFEAYKKLPSMDALRGLLALHRTGSNVPTTQLATKVRLVNASLWKLEHVFEEHPPIAEGSWSDPAGDLPNQFPLPPNQWWTPLRTSQLGSDLPQAEKKQFPSPRPTTEGLSVLISTANSALNSQFRVQVDGDSIDKTSLGAINTSLQAVYQAMGAKTSLKAKEKELKGLQKTYQELTIKLDELKNERNDNIIGYSIMRWFVAPKFSGCNIIELDQLAIEESHKGEQPAFVQASEPTHVKAVAKIPRKGKTSWSSAPLRRNPQQMLQEPVRSLRRL
ncbi:hypothetical protein FNV43_RR13094 [Rhamnella rubrinervis]|uniref:Uncharacterized protein n=1 Tax=Rhamnella rubrinervis TaxID=2594499 RepID=A0A8K0H0G2_9ROSA|nr:hypothetical protein FNV43_RR13094 [Rhamnella rubrinervis]